MRSAKGRSKGRGGGVCIESFDAPFRRGGRAVEGSGLENRQGRKSLEGSNPSLSAISAWLGVRPISVAEPLLIETKLGFVAVVLIAGLTGGAFALRSGTRLVDASRLGLGNAFAAGVFLSVGLVHMLPHAAEIWENLGWRYPMASMLGTAAFLLMLLIEHVFLPREISPRPPRADRAQLRLAGQ